MKLTLHFQQAPGGEIACSLIAKQTTGRTIAHATGSMTLDREKGVRTYELDVQGHALCREFPSWTEAEADEIMHGKADPMATQEVAAAKRLRRAGRG